MNRTGSARSATLALAAALLSAALLGCEGDMTRDAGGGQGDGDSPGRALDASLDGRAPLEDAGDGGSDAGDGGADAGDGGTDAGDGGADGGDGGPDALTD